MRKFFSLKGDLIAKCIVFQIAMSLLGFFVMTALAFMSKTVILLGGIFSVLFYYAIMGAALNEDGLKDGLIISKNNGNPDKYLGLKYVAVSYIPSLIMTVLIAVFRTFEIAVEASGVLVYIVKIFFTGMYFGIDMYLFNSGVDANGNALYSTFSINGYSLIIYQIVSIIVCGVFYYIGTRGINLLKTKEKK